MPRFTIACALLITLLAAASFQLSCGQRPRESGARRGGGATAGTIELPPSWQRRATLGGSVHSGAAPVAGATVRLLQLVAQQRIPRGTQVTDSRGAFRVPHRLPAGAYVVETAKAGWAAEAHAIWVDDGSNHLDVRSMALGSTISGRVGDEDGVAITGATVQLTPLGQPPEVPPRTVVTDTMGRFADSTLHEGRYRIEVTRDGFRRAIRAALRVPAVDVSLRMLRLYEVDGSVGEARAATVMAVGSGLWPGKSVHTDRGGGFRLTAVPAGIYDLVAFTDHPPWRASVPQLGVEVDRSTSRRLALALALEPAQRVQGRVVQQSGIPVAGAQVIVSRTAASMLRFRAQTGADGSFELLPLAYGSYQIAVFSDNHLPLIGTKLEVPAELPVTLELAAGAAVRGMVVDGQGRPVMGAVVRCVGRTLPGAAAWNDSVGELGVMPGPIPPIPLEGELPATFVSSSGVGTALTDATGNFRLTGLFPGDVRVRAEHPDFASGQTDWFQLAPSQVRERVLVKLATAGLVQGTVLDPRGWPLSGAEVTLHNDLDRRYQITAANGTYRVTGLSGRYELMVRLGGHVPAHAVVQLRAGQELGHDIVLQPATGRIGGGVYDAARSPIGGARVVAVQGDHRVEQRTDGSGRFELAGLSQASVELSVSHPGFVTARRTTPIGSRPDILLAPAASLTGTVVDSRTGAHVTQCTATVIAEDGARPSLAAHCTRAGEFRLLDLTPGLVRVRVDSAGYARATVTTEIPVPARPGETAPHVLAAQLAPAGTVTGTLADLNGQAVANAEVRVAGVASTTNTRGEFSLTTVPEGTHPIEVRLAGGAFVKVDSVVVRAAQTNGPFRLMLPSVPGR